MLAWLIEASSCIFVIVSKWSITVPGFLLFLYTCVFDADAAPAPRSRVMEDVNAMVMRIR